MYTNVVQWPVQVEQLGGIGVNGFASKSNIGCMVYYESLTNQGGLIPDLGVDVLQIGACPADFDHNGVVNAADLAEVLSSWGPYGPCPPFMATDFDQDCDVDAADLAELLSAWGACQ